MIAAQDIRYGFSYLLVCVMNATRGMTARKSDDSFVSLLSKTCSLVFYDKEGSALINLHIFQSCAGDKIHALPYCAIWGGLFLRQASRVILEGLAV